MIRLLLSLLLILPLLAQAQTLQIDPAHSSITFGIRHLISQTTGRFTEFVGTIVLDEKAPVKSKVDATIQTKSVDTDNQKRDDHLRSPDFFDAAKFPTITFTSAAIEKTGADTGKITGKLTMHGVTKDVVLATKYLGKTADPFEPKKTRYGFSATTTVNRKDFAINFNKVLDKGSLMLGEEVTITLNIEAITP